jgi:U4/U6.U5 tri-snRNP-associated protein 2
VNFPVRNVDLASLVNDNNDGDDNRGSKNMEEQVTSYDLLANVTHVGKPDKGQGVYKVHIRHRGSENGQQQHQQRWFQMQDLLIDEIQPEMVTLSETYVQVKHL